MEKYPELRWLDKHHWVPTTVFGTSVYLIGGAHWFFWACALAMVVLYHATFTINSLAHVWGSKRFPRVTKAAITWCWRCSPWAKVGTITTISA